MLSTKMSPALLSEAFSACLEHDLFALSEAQRVCTADNQSYQMLFLSGKSLSVGNRPVTPKTPEHAMKL
jgi:hypothetical protein